MWRTLRPNKEDRVAKLEWAANGGLGRVVMGKVGYTFLMEGEPSFFSYRSLFRMLCEWRIWLDRKP